MYLVSIVLGFTSLAVANPILSIFARQAQNVNINWQITDSQFRSFENPATLRQYFQSRGYNYNLNYNQLAQGVAAIDRYFDQAARSTSGTNNGGLSTGIDPASVQTNTVSTTLQGGPSYTNISLTANTALTEAISFSNGNAATAGGAIQLTQTASGTSSSGASNSTASVTGSEQVNRIITTAVVNGANDSRDVEGGPRDAFTGGSCAARSTGASARASIVTTLNVPVNITGSTTASSVARSFCEAGVAARRAGTPGGSGTSSSGMQAALTDGGVIVSVVCNGRRSSGSASTNYNVLIRGTYSASRGFEGTFTGIRTSNATVSCS